MPGTQSPWWQGRRGEWYVVAQFVAGAVVVFGPRTLPSFPEWPPPLAGLSLLAGAILLVAGLCLLAAGTFRLGANLTPLPYPKENATLVQSGAYRFVRHPLYAGVLMLAFGWGFAVRGWLTLGYATILLIILEFKSAREERWLLEKFPEYRDYRKRVGKFIPFLH